MKRSVWLAVVACAACLAAGCASIPSGDESGLATPGMGAERYGRDAAEDR